MSANLPPTAATRAPATDSRAGSNSPALFVKFGRILVWMAYILAVVTAVLLLMAFSLKLLGANPDSGFTEWVMRSTELAMRPFRGIFPPADLAGKSVFDTSLLFATLVYALLAVALDALQHWLRHVMTRLAVRSHL